MKILKKTAVFFALLFCAELILGFTGTMIMIGDVAIRHILFILSFISMYLYFAAYLLCNKVKIFSFDKESYFGGYTWIDILAVLFELSMILSMTVIPWMKGTSLQYAHREVFDSAAVFSLFFPVSFFIKKREFTMEKLLLFLKYVIFILALVHIGMYFAQEADPDFIFAFFEAVGNALGGNSIAPSITLGHGGYTRMIFTTSVYLIVGLYIFFHDFQNNKWYDYVIYVVEVLAVLTTVTKSIWFGLCGGFALYFVLSVFVNIKNNKKYIVKLIGITVLTALIVLVADQTVLDNIVSIRMGNAFAVADNEQQIEVNDNTGSSSNNSDKKKYKSEKEQFMNELDKAGAVESNSIKLEQMQKLTEKWMDSPILGWGYGSYVEEYLRSETSPFSYEMQFFALLMKIGILGIAVWLIFFLVQIVMLIKNANRSYRQFIAWLFLVVSFALCVQTNPLLICFTGMSIIILISLISVQGVADAKNI